MKTFKEFKIEEIISLPLQEFEIFVKENDINNVFDDIPLMLKVINSTCNNKHEKIDILLENDIDVNDYNTAGDTALHWSSVYGDYSLIKKLLEHGADPNQKSVTEVYPTDILSSNNKDFEKIVRLFIKNNAHITFTKTQYMNLFSDESWQRYFLTYQPHNINNLMKHVKMTDNIKKEYSHLIDGSELGII